MQARIDRTIDPEDKGNKNAISGYAGLNAS